MLCVQCGRALLCLPVGNVVLHGGEQVVVSIVTWPWGYRFGDEVVEGSATIQRIAYTLWSCYDPE